MTEIIFASIISFVSTNLDDLFVMMLLLAGKDIRTYFVSSLLGRYLGMGAILAVSLFGAFGLGFIPPAYIKLLGFVPIILGIKEFVSYKMGKDDDDTEMKGNSLLFGTALITLANGADNIGVYLPLFAGYGWIEMLVTAAVFAVMTLLWHILSVKLADLPMLKRGIERYRHIAVPVIYVLLGVYILIF